MDSTYNYIVIIDKWEKTITIKHLSNEEKEMSEEEFIDYLTIPQSDCSWFFSKYEPSVEYKSEDELIYE